MQTFRIFDQFKFYVGIADAIHIHTSKQRIYTESSTHKGHTSPFDVTISFSFYYNFSTLHNY